MHRQRSKLLDVVQRQFSHNIRLSADLALANDILTNRYFNAASSFVSNVVSSIAVTNSPSSSKSLLALSASLSVDPEDIPPLSFSHYFEIDGIAYIRLRNQNLKKGDFVLGYPVEDISPDVVKYRGKYFKVDEVKP